MEKKKMQAEESGTLYMSQLSLKDYYSTALS